MRRTSHIEKHFTASDTVRDIVIGMSDGLTVPFALAAGLSGADRGFDEPNHHKLGWRSRRRRAIAMGLGGYFGCASRCRALPHGTGLAKNWKRSSFRRPNTPEVADVFRAYGLPEATVKTVVDAICADQKRWVDFMMKFELGMEEPDPHGRARNSRHHDRHILHRWRNGALGRSTSYSDRSTLQCWDSVIVTLVALFGFGYVKGKFTTHHPHGACALRDRTGRRSRRLGGVCDCQDLQLSQEAS